MIMMLKACGRQKKKEHTSYSIQRSIFLLSPFFYSSYASVCVSVFFFQKIFLCTLADCRHYYCYYYCYCCPRHHYYIHAYVRKKNERTEERTLTTMTAIPVRKIVSIGHLFFFSFHCSEYLLTIHME
jgi:hypothetical protein